MDKKYELTNESIEEYGRKLYRIRALRDFSDVKKGDLGGYVQSEENLSQEGNCWIYDNGMVYDNAKLIDSANISGNAIIEEHAKLCDYSQIRGNARIFGYSLVSGKSTVEDDAVVFDHARILGHSTVKGDTTVCGNARVFANAKIYGSYINGEAEIGKDALIQKAADFVTVRGFGLSQRVTTFFRRSDNEIGVVCGCFQGNSLDEFRNQVKETRSGKIEEEYLMIADLMEHHFYENQIPVYKTVVEIRRNIE